MELRASYHQERLWFINQFEAGNLYESSPVYHNIPLILWLKGKINKKLMEKSIKAVIHRHQALRTRVITKDSQPFQVIDAEPAFKLMLRDLTNYSGENIEEYAKNQAINFAKLPFKLDRDHLIRAQLIELRGNMFILVLSIHHIISDRYSLKIISQEIFSHYNAFLNGGSPGLPAVSANYTDFSQWQHTFCQDGDVLEPLLFYWKRKLKGKIQPLELPTDRPRAAVHIFHDGRGQFEINSLLFTKIETFCRQNKIDKSLVLLATFKILLYKYTGQEEILVGIIDENRNQPGLEHIVGPIANLLVLRSFLDGKSNFFKVLQDLDRTVTDAKKHKHIPFEKLDQELKPAKDMSRTVFFDVLFQYEKNHGETISPDNPGIKILETNMGYGKYDINLLLREGMNGVPGYLIYNKDYYDESTITRFITHYMNLLESILENPGREISDLAMMTREEKKKLLVDFNDTDAVYPKEKTVHRLFVQQAEQFPHHTALVVKEEKGKGLRYLSYGELNKKSHSLAGLLIQKGVRSDTIVAILPERSLEMIVAMLAILKAGGAYLPIDPDYPEERIRYMIKDSNAKILLTTSGLSEKFEKLSIVNCQLLIVNEMLSNRRRLNNPPKEANSINNYQLTIHNSQLERTNLAYIIYTSGTTGKPKGVLVEHGNVVRLMFNDAFPFDFHHADTWTMFHSCCFDFSVWEMYGALLYGGRLVIIPKMTARDTAIFLQRILEERVTVLNQTPSAFYRLIDEELKQEQPRLRLKYVIFGGETLNPGKLKEWKARYPETRLINMFGITETTVHVTYKEITQKEIDFSIGNIGRPIPTLKVYVLDRNMNLAPIGVAGELCVGGDGVARGYLNRPALTAEKFDHDLWDLPDYRDGYHRSHKSYMSYISKRIYKSGDLGRFLENGEMIYLGRIDTQVKIRGHRIEPGEIENQMVSHQQVKDVVVIDRQDKHGDKYLCAYVVLHPSAVEVSPGSSHATSTAELRNYLSGRLPDYMIPSYFVRLEKIPLTSNGKVDRNRLPGPEIDTGDEYVAPRDEVEKGIVYILSDILGIDAAKISVRANFFDIGVNSVTLLKIAHRVSGEFRIQLLISTLFTNPSVEELVKNMHQEKTAFKTKRLVLLNRGTASRNMFLLYADGTVYVYKDLAKLLESQFNVYAFQARGIMDTGQLPLTAKDIFDEYIAEMKMVQPHGPYLIGGHCFGAFIGYELAKTLEDQKEQVEKVLFLDEPAFMDEKLLDNLRAFRFRNRMIKIYLGLRSFFKKKPGTKNKADEQEKSNNNPGTLPENLEVRRKEVEDNFQRIFANMMHFKRIINTPVLVLKAMIQPYRPNKKQAQRERWLPRVVSKMSTKPVEIVETPGDHFTMFDPPHVSELAKILLEKLAPPED